MVNKSKNIALIATLYLLNLNISYADSNNTIYSIKDDFLVKAKKIAKEANATKIKKYEKVSNKFAKRNADEIAQKKESKEFKEKVQNMKDYFFKDKQLKKMYNENIYKYIPSNKNNKNNEFKHNYINIYDNNVNKHNNTNLHNNTKKPYSNRYLHNNERLIICISSSIPMVTLRNYVKILKNVESDVLFALNGFIDNTRSFKKTREFIWKLLKKDDKHYYPYIVQINPKIFTKYDIKRVPAVIFIKNYSPLMEISGAGYKPNKKDTEKENIFIAYGDYDIVEVLKKINKKAKSKGLQNLINHIGDNFFQVKKDNK